MNAFVTKEAWELYTPIALQLVDSLTGGTPVAAVKTILEQRDPSGSWILQGRQPVVTSGGILTFPALDRRSRASGMPARRYRVRFESDAYEPDYLSHAATTDGIEFNSFPYNDDTPPVAFANQVTKVALHPSPRYPFPPETPVLRGFVVRLGSSVRVPKSLVAEGLHDRTITDRRGEFALPLRQVAANVPTPIDATDSLSLPNQTGTATIVLPAALGFANQITIA